MTIQIKIILILLTAIGLYTFYSYYRTKNYIQIGNSLAAGAKVYEQHPTNGRLKILTIGDSSVVGTGASSPEKSVAGLLGKDFPEADITNLGVNGSKVKDLIERLEKIKGQKFDLILMHIGGNDIVRLTNLKDFEKDLNIVLAKLNNLSNNIITLHGGNVGTAGLFPFGTRWIFTFRTWQIRNIYLSATKEKNVHYIDLWRNKENDPFAADMKVYYAADLFHPSDEGYADWYSFIKQELTKIKL